MSRRRKVGITVGVLLAITCMAVVAWRIWYVNQKYPQETIVVIAYGESGRLQQEIEMKVLGCEWIPFEEEERIETQTDGYNYIVTIRLENVGQEAQEADLTRLYIGLDGYSNGIDMEKYLVRNEAVGTLHPLLESGETLEVDLVYQIHDSQWKKKDWKHVTEKIFYVQRMDYPYLYKWSCQEYTSL